MSIYQINQIADNLYSIKEDLSGNRFPILIYLVVGKEKAALIDTGLGTDDLKAVVETITNLPVIVLHTHGHIDHTGADALFDEIYLNEREYGQNSDGYDYTGSAEKRLKLIQFQLQSKPDLLEYISKHIIIGAKRDYQHIDDGDVINLGGIELLAVSTPGHTPGSISYVSKTGHYAFTGDGIADIHWFDDDYSIGVENFLRTLVHFQKNAKGVHKFYAAHIPQPFGIELIHNLQTAARDIIGGSDDKIENADYHFLKHGELYAHRCGAATIYYKNELVYAKEIRPEFIDGYGAKAIQ